MMISIKVDVNNGVIDISEFAKNHKGEVKFLIMPLKGGPCVSRTMHSVEYINQLKEAYEGQEGDNIHLDRDALLTPLKRVKKAWLIYDLDPKEDDIDVCPTCKGPLKFIKNGKLVDGRCTYKYCGFCHREVRNTKLYEDTRNDLRELMKYV